MYKVYMLIKEIHREGYKACFVCEFTKKEKAIEYVNARKTNYIVSKDGKIVYQNY